MSVTLSTRVAEDTLQRLRSAAAQEARSVSELANRAIEEYVRCTRFPGVFFVTGGNGQRKARVAGGPSVWSVVLVARELGMDPVKTAEHLEIPVEQARLALAYYYAYPHEIDARLRRLEEVDENPYLLGPRVRIMEV